MKTAEALNILDSSARKHGFNDWLHAGFLREPAELTHIIVDAMEEYASQLKTVEEPLRNLLAILHRDGGHYTAKHGLEKSVNDAINLIHKEWVSSEFKTVEPEKQETLCSHNVIDLNKHGDFYCKICLARL